MNSTIRFLLILGVLVSLVSACDDNKVDHNKAEWFAEVNERQHQGLLLDTPTPEATFTWNGLEERPGNEW